MPELTPNYLQTDYSTLVQKFIDELKNNSSIGGVFKDVDYEGSNIRTLIELLSYIGELQIFYNNKIAKNMFEETADIFETAHSLARQKGYDPKGPRTSKATLTVIIDNSNNVIKLGDILTVSPWSQLRCNSSTQYENEIIQFATTYDIENSSSTTLNYQHTIGSSNMKTSNSKGVSGSWVEFDVPVRQGVIKTYSDIYGRDIIDNQLILPLLDFSYDEDINDTYPAIQLTINDEIWTRVGDFYDEMTGLEGENRNIYKFEYDKYRRNRIVFSSSRNVPKDTDTIEIKVLQTLGGNGNVGANTIQTIASPSTFIWNNNGGDTGTGGYVTGSLIEITNTGASSSGSAPEILSEIRDNSRSKLHAQYRNVTSRDYIADLEERSDIVAANAWGEQEIAPSGGDTREYNKVYLSIIPDVWTSQTISAGNNALIRTVNSAPLSASIINPLSYSEDFKSAILKYIEPRKMLNAYEILEVPQLIYFYFDIEVKILRSYMWADVQRDILDKLEYYFNPINRNFGELIDFFNIGYYIQDPLEFSNSNRFSNVKGIETLEFRDIDCNVVIYEPNVSSNPRKYPQYTVNASHWAGDNKLRKIQLDYTQFPMLAKTICRIIQG